MKRKIVDSSLLASIGYDKKEKILEVEFTHGGIYQYMDVPAEEYKALMSADSHGQYFIANIRNDFDYVLLSKR